MNSFVLEIWDDEAEKCTFYTVRKDGAKDTETDKFFRKYSAVPALKQYTQMLLSFVLDSIGDDHGAIDLLFNRFENEVIGLPNKGKATLGEISFFYPDFPLRLYALKVNNRDDLVVLFNGGIKSASTNQSSKDLNLKWREACQFAKRIDQALQDKEISIDTKNRKIRPNDGEEVIL